MDLPKYSTDAMMNINNMLFSGVCLNSVALRQRMMFRTKKNTNQKPTRHREKHRKNVVIMTCISSLAGYAIKLNSFSSVHSSLWIPIMMYI